MEKEMSSIEEKIVIGVILAEITFALLTLLTIFLPFIKMGSQGYEGLYLAFGGGDYGSIKVFKFSFLNFLSFLSIVIALVLGFVRLAVPMLDNKITKLVMFGFTILSALLFPLSKAICKMNINVAQNVLHLGFGAIIATILSVVLAIGIVLDFYFISIKGLKTISKADTSIRRVDNEEQDKVLKESENTNSER